MMPIRPVILTLVLCCGCSLLLDVPTEPRGPRYAVEGDTLQFDLRPPASAGRFRVQLRVGDSLYGWSDEFERKTSLLTEAVFPEPGRFLVNWRYQAAAGGVSEWSRAAVVSVYPYPGYPAYPGWYIRLPEGAAVAVDDSLTVAVAANSDSIVTISLVTRQRVAARQFASAGRLTLSPDGQQVYAFRRDTAFVLAVTDLSTTDTLLIGSDYSAVLALDNSLLLCREPDVVRYDLQLHRYTDSVELPHVTTLTRSPGGRIFAWSSYSQPHVVELGPSLDRILRNYVVRGYVTGLGFDPASDDLWVSSQSDDSSRFTCFSAASSRLQRELTVEDRPCGGFDLSPVKPWLVYPFDGGRSLRVIDTRDGRMIDLVGFSYCRDYHISPDGSEAVAFGPGRLSGFSVYK